jgi:hypothetical protein
MKRTACFVFLFALILLSFGWSGNAVDAQEPLDGPNRPFKGTRKESGRRLPLTRYAALEPQRSTKGTRH